MKMNAQGIIPTFQSELAHIFVLSARGDEEGAKLLIDKALAKYGNDKKPECLAAQIRGSVSYGNMDMLRKLLRSAVVTSDNIKLIDISHKPTARLILLIPYDALFDIIWRLAKRSRKRDGQEFSGLTLQILESAQRTTGYFKRLMRETERHIAHGHYYSATSLLSDTTRVKSQMETQRKFCMTFLF